MNCTVRFGNYFLSSTELTAPAAKASWETLIRSLSNLMYSSFCLLVVTFQLVRILDDHSVINVYLDHSGGKVLEPLLVVGNVLLEQNWLRISPIGTNSQLYEKYKFKSR